MSIKIEELSMAALAHAEYWEFVDLMRDGVQAHLDATTPEERRSARELVELADFNLKLRRLTFGQEG